MRFMILENWYQMFTKLTDIKCNFMEFRKHFQRRLYRR